MPLDVGNDSFTPSRIELTSIDVGNNVRNVIPGTAVAKANIRFNDIWNFEKLEDYVRRCTPSNVELSFERFGVPFIGSDRRFIEFLRGILTEVTGAEPQIGTSGGNSDAIFIRDITDVVEIGSPISGAHVVNEFILKTDLIKLKKIYFHILTQGTLLKD
jgi:succinyl-diaminopimelate desuccinylase